jgi:hypothetical protein
MLIRELLETTPRARDEAWLKEALQAAVDLEFFTIPPYLLALWSIKDERSYAAQTIREVVYEEMQHMALACNLLAAIGGVPRINRAPTVPVYPRPLPGGVRPDLIIGLSGLTPDVVKVFMQVEMPENPILFPQAEGLEMAGEVFSTIGAFYQAIQTTFHQLKGLRLSVDRQISGPLAPLVIVDLDSVDTAINLIRVQGEGTDVSPLEDGAATEKPVPEIPSAGRVNAGPANVAPGPHLAHYYRFQELNQGQRLRYQQKQRIFAWADKLVFPDTFPVAQVPAGGYRDGDVTSDVAANLQAFDQAYTHVLDELQSAWESGGQAALWRAVEWMFSLRDRARVLMEMPIPGTETTYGPCFRYLGKSAG